MLEGLHKEKKISKLWWDRVIAIVLICGAGSLMYMALQFPRGAGLFPLFSGSLVVLTSLVLLISGVFSRSQERAEAVSWNNVKPYLLFVLLLVAVILADRLGYFTSMVLFSICGCLLIGAKVRRLHVVLGATAIVMITIYLVFVLALRVDFPQGVLP